MFRQYLQWFGILHAEKREYRISNMEFRMLKLYSRGKKLHHSTRIPKLETDIEYVGQHNSIPGGPKGR
jgi:hypothetical protein